MVVIPGAFPTRTLLDSPLTTLPAWDFVRIVEHCCLWSFFISFMWKGGTGLPAFQIRKVACRRGISFVPKKMFVKNLQLWDVDVGSIKRVLQKGVPPARLSKCNISFANDQNNKFHPKNMSSPKTRNPKGADAPYLLCRFCDRFRVVCEKMLGVNRPMRRWEERGRQVGGEGVPENL